MRTKLLLAAAAPFHALAAAAAAAISSQSASPSSAPPPPAPSHERLLGAYIFHRHGDRTAKAHRPVSLTPLGAIQARDSGGAYRARYHPEAGQVTASSPRDPVLRGSALAFLQGLLPPEHRSEILADGRLVEDPQSLGGAALVPLDGAQGVAIREAIRPEESAWLQGETGCLNAEASSTAYFASAEFQRASKESEAFYQSLLPVINGTFESDAASFRNGYSIFDLVNVGFIHDPTIRKHPLLADGVALRHLQSLASQHEWNLAYNASEPVRAVAGAVLAGQVVAQLQATINANTSKPRFHVQFGPYATFMSFFGLAKLYTTNPDLMGICEYASSMVFELVTDAGVATAAVEDVHVRFLFANGTAARSELRSLPLFNQTRSSLPWTEFVSGMEAFALSDRQQWCTLCGITEGACAAPHVARFGASNDCTHGDKMSRSVAGVIGATVTLVIVTSLQLAVFLCGGLRLTKKCKGMARNSNKTS